MKTHVQLLGWISIISGVCSGLLGLILFGLFSLLAPTTNDPGGSVGLLVMAVLIGGSLVVLGIPALIAGIGLLRRKPWARILALIVGVFGFFAFPIGTLIALYAFWVLTNAEAVNILDQRVQNTPTPGAPTLQTS